MEEIKRPNILIRGAKPYIIKIKLLDMLSIYNYDKTYGSNVYLIKLYIFDYISFKEKFIGEKEIAENQKDFLEFNIEFSFLSGQEIIIEILELINHGKKDSNFNTGINIGRLNFSILDVVKKGSIIKQMFDDNFFPKGKLHIEISSNFDYLVLFEFKMEFFIRGMFQNKNIKSKFIIKNKNSEILYNSDFISIAAVSKFSPLEFLTPINYSDIDINNFFEIQFLFYDSNNTLISTQSSFIKLKEEHFNKIKNFNKVYHSFHIIKKEFANKSEGKDKKINNLFKIISEENINYDFDDYCIRYRIKTNGYYFRDYTNSFSSKFLILIDISKSVLELYPQKYIYYILLKNFLQIFVKIILILFDQVRIKFICVEDELEYYFTRSFINNEHSIDKMLWEVMFTLKINFELHSEIMKEILKIDADGKNAVLVISDFCFIDIKNFLAFQKEHSLKDKNLIITNVVLTDQELLLQKHGTDWNKLRYPNSNYEGIYNFLFSF